MLKTVVLVNIFALNICIQLQQKYSNSIIGFIVTFCKEPITGLLFSSWSAGGASHQAPAEHYLSLGLCHTCALPYSI